MTAYAEMMGNVSLPEMVRIRQKLPDNHIDDVSLAVLSELNRGVISATIQPGASVAITGGSRGLDRIPAVLRTIVEFCKDKGAHPFIIPAMGSHGGGTASGQRAILESYGITEEFCGCPIKAGMEVVEIGVTEEGHRVCIDRYASQADAIILVNRIKAHTAFRGPYESGLMKMCTIGLGKQAGAGVCHATGFGEMHRLVPLFGKVILKNASIAFGVALIENAHDKLCHVEALLPHEIIEKEPRLLEKAKGLMGKIPFAHADVLIVDEIGKNFSGEGADPNITGRFPTPYASGGLSAERRVCLRLSEQSHGCGYGIGLFDTTTTHLFNQIDFNSTYINALTNTVLSAVSIPLMMPSDRDAIAAAMCSCNRADFNKPRIIRIANTAHIEEMYISRALLPEAEENPDISILSAPAPFCFDESGNLHGF